MQDWLVPIFGVWGAVVVQFVLTVAIVLGLIAIAWWLVRQYSGVRLGGIGRGRVPRLAVVEAAHVDRRRKLVLVRRDNVEHLLLIGGPADLVVEPMINRQRMRPPQQAGQTAGAPAGQPAAASLPADAPPVDTPVAVTPRAPSPPPRPAPAPAARPSAPTSLPVMDRDDDEAENHRAAELALLMRTAAPLADEDQPTLPDIVPDEPPPAPVPARAALPFFTPLPEEPPQPSLDLGENEAPATAAEEPPQAAEGEAKVSDLEREMARLLGEITARRSS
jgi:hypothetical protein